MRGDLAGHRDSRIWFGCIEEKRLEAGDGGYRSVGKHCIVPRLREMSSVFLKIP